jgi:hypothetical protein
MMPGVAAQPLGRSSGSSAPTGTLASAKFRSGLYSVAGAPVLLSSIVDQPELVSAAGLEIAEDGTVAAILGTFLDVLKTANWTLRLKWNNFDSNSTFFPLVLTGADFDNVVQLRRQNSLSNRYMNVEDFAGPDFRDATDASAPAGDGAHIIALTRTDTKLVFSLDGRAVVTAAGDPLDFALDVTDACFGGYPGDTVFGALTIESLDVFEPMDDSLLPALSA